jgi:hypothetical protein
VTSAQHEGIFEIVFVNTLMQTANTRLLDGSGHVVPNVAVNFIESSGQGVSRFSEDHFSRRFQFKISCRVELHMIA